jgi:hypothetical protein
MASGAREILLIKKNAPRQLWYLQNQRFQAPGLKRNKIPTRMTVPATTTLPSANLIVPNNRPLRTQKKKANDDDEKDKSQTYNCYYFLSRRQSWHYKVQQPYKVSSDSIIMYSWGSVAMRKMAAHRRLFCIPSSSSQVISWFLLLTHLVSLLPSFAWRWCFGLELQGLSSWLLRT